MNIQELGLPFTLVVSFFLASGVRAQDEEIQPFFAYLQSAKPSVAVYTPSKWDPSSQTPPARASIKADLAALRPAFDGLALYAYRADMTPVILDEAIAQGYRAVMLGVWDPKSPQELEGVARAIKERRDRLAFAIVIGNEGLNDARYKMHEVKAGAAFLQFALPAGLRVPMTTSEPVGDYGWPPLLEFGDFLAPNIHPALDRRALAPDAAARWALDRAKALTRIADKPVVVKETGFPNGGGLGASPEAQAAYWATWLAQGRLIPPPRDAGSSEMWISTAFAFEAFDAPWKAIALGNPIEGRWGLMSADRAPYPAFSVWAAKR